MKKIILEIIVSFLIKSKNINLRLIEIEDAGFIVKLRLTRGLFLSKISNNIEIQKRWIIKYKEREYQNKEYYFIIESKDIKIGSIRAYSIDYKRKEFSFGSFIIINNTVYKYASLESITEFFGFSFNTLNLDTCYFKCHKKNKKANIFYTRFQAECIGENNLEYFYKYDKKKFMNNILYYKSIYDSIS